MRVLVLGHPRSGTGYAAHCFRQSGWDVGHEKRGQDGIASWMWAADCGWSVPWGDARGEDPPPEIILHLLRNPADCVSSVAFTEQASEEWRRKWVAIPQDFGDLERAVWSIYGWNRLIRRFPPTHTARLDEIERTVGEITGRAPAAPRVIWRNAREHRTLSADEIKATHWVHPNTAQLWDQLVADYEGAAR